MLAPHPRHWQPSSIFGKQTTKTCRVNRSRKAGGKCQHCPHHPSWLPSLCSRSDGRQVGLALLQDRDGDGDLEFPTQEGNFPGSTDTMSFLKELNLSGFVPDVGTTAVSPGWAGGSGESSVLPFPTPQKLSGDSIPRFYFSSCPPDPFPEPVPAPAHLCLGWTLPWCLAQLEEVCSHLCLPHTWHSAQTPMPLFLIPAESCQSRFGVPGVRAAAVAWDYRRDERHCSSPHFIIALPLQTRSGNTPNPSVPAAPASPRGRDGADGASGAPGAKAPGRER